MDDFRRMLRTHKPDDIEVEVTSLGERDNTSSDVTGVSGTKMRFAKSKNNIATFERGTGLNRDLADTLMKQVRNGMSGVTRQSFM